MQKKWIKRFVYIFILLCICFLLLIRLSPYRIQSNGKKEIQAEVYILATVKQVFDFLGNSENAKKWSVFVKDIKPLNNKEIQDGQINSVRRCYVKEEIFQNAYWDEVITEYEYLKRRQLRIYNLQNFSLSADGLLTEQVYLPIDNQHTKIIFKLFFEQDKINLYDEFKMYLAAIKIKSIFSHNLENIKRIIESENNTNCLDQ